ncbi:MAG: VTC domain-containing protein [Caldithrix sp.]|nr:VTC domain-containing protein [Caldithrix sp.]
MRLEYKFLLPNEKLNPLRERLMPYVRLDTFSQERPDKHYTVRSIYFDTLRLKHYNDKIEGIRTRKKVRIRAYNTLQADHPVFLEIKRKYENYISKDRSILKFDQLEQFLEGQNFDWSPLKSTEKPDNFINAQRFLYQVMRYHLQPTVLCVYEREAFYAESNPQLRITFDKNLRALQFPRIDQLKENQQLFQVLPHHFIMEVKFRRGFAFWLRRILEDFNLTRQALSKYTMSLFLKNQRNPFFGRVDYAYLNRHSITRQPLRRNRF